tara:strand:+ start:436 stop:666 length:231 start_codon:yes stop_codon:yes gene_type:complete
LLRRNINTKKLPTLPSTGINIKSSDAIPHCMPFVIGSSGAPKQTAHDCTELGNAVKTKIIKKTKTERIQFINNQSA